MNNVKKIDLLSGNILAALTKLALPLMGMNFLQMAYNLTDMFWVGKLGAESVAAIGTGGLFIWFCSGIHMLYQVGGQVYVGQNLGAGDNEKAGRFAYAAIIMCLVITAFLGITFVLFSHQLVSLFKLDNEQTIKEAIDYIKITGGLIVFLLLARLLTVLITTTGNGRIPFIASFIGLAFNMVLDPMLIFGTGIFPELGVTGAAIATVFAQFIMGLVLVIYATRDKYLFKYINLRKLPKLTYFKDIIKLGFPVSIQATFYPFIAMCISRTVASFGYNAIAVQRIGSQVESLTWMVVEGFSTALNGFIAQNYGANNIPRLKKGFKEAFKILAIWGVFVTLLLTVFARQIFRIFIDEAQVIDIGADYLVIIGLSQLFMSMEIMSLGSLNAIGKTKLSSAVATIFTALRIPMALILSATVLGLNGVWWSISISSICKGTILIIVVVFAFRKLKGKS